MTTRSQARSRDVTIIADNPETIDGLHSYLQTAGVPSRTTRALHDAAAVPLGTTAIVLFPDEFDAKEVVARITSVRTSRPRLLIVVVTSLPHRLAPALDPDGHSMLPVVLPKPAFGWSILDAIRAHVRLGTP